MPDPWRPDQMVVRGSSWFPLDRHLSVTVSSGLDPNNPDNTMGFRTFRHSRQPMGEGCDDGHKD